MKKILVVDDELPILTGLSKALRELCGFEGDIRTVVNGREAIHETGCCFYDICFLDIKLPDINGIDVLHDIQETSPETNIILMSASHLQKDMRRLVDNGSAFYIEKPFDFDRIKYIMKLALDGDGDYSLNHLKGGKAAISGKRKYRRRPIEKIVSFFIKESNFMEFKGALVDISYEGAGINTYYPLERGQVLLFNRGIAHKAGFVAWSVRAAENNYRVGVKFI